MVKKITCLKCDKQFNNCLECTACQDTVCINCALCLSDPDVEYDMFFCSKSCLIKFTDVEYDHGNGD
jgi:hypothetical protein